MVDADVAVCAIAVEFFYSFLFVVITGGGANTTIYFDLLFLFPP